MSLRTIGRYELLKRLAVGGMGEVYLARQQSNIEGFVRLFAIKVLLQSYSTNSSFVAMFLDEARTAAKLHHKNIVQVLNIDRHDDQYYIVMEYISGQNLRELLGDATIPGRSLFDPRLGAETFAEIADALIAVHAAGLIHRDISPNNIMISDSGVPKLIDFGVARATSSTSMTTPGTLKGKFGYMAPEYVRGHGYDHRADVFSLGVVMWETFCRKRLFRGTSAAEQLHHLLEGEIPLVTDVVPDFPIELAEVIAIALHRDPAMRFPTASAMANAITQVAINLPPSPDNNLAGWLQRNVGFRMTERKRSDEALAAMPEDADIVMFDEPGASPGSVPGTYGLSRPPGGTSPPRNVPGGTSPPKNVPRASRPSIPQMSNQFAAAPDDGGTSIQGSAGEVGQVGQVPQVQRPSRRFVIFGVAAAVVVAALLVILLRRPSTPANAPTPAAATAAPAAPTRGTSDVELGEAHRRIGLKALADKEFARARQEFTEAMAYAGASPDLSELLKLATELEVAANQPKPAPVAAVAATSPPHEPPSDAVALVPPPKSDPDPAKPAKPAKRVEPKRVEKRAEPRRPEPKHAPRVEVAEPKPAPPAEEKRDGQLVVTSTPPKLLVRVDGKVMGQTPLRIPLPAGPHQVVLVQNDRAVHTESAMLRDDDQTFVHAEVATVAAQPPPEATPPAPAPPPRPVTPPPAPRPAAAPTQVGELEVISPNVVGEVFVNGVARGWPPVVVKGVPAGKVRVEIRVDGDVRRTKSVTVTSSKRATVRFN